MEVNETNFNNLKHEIIQVSQFLIKNLDDHIYKENNVLYPMALKVLDKHE